MFILDDLLQYRRLEFLELYEKEQVKHMKFSTQHAKNDAYPLQS